MFVTVNTAITDIGILEFISKIVSSLAWPLVIFIIVMIFRKELKKRFSSISKFTFGNGEILFSDALPESIETKQKSTDSTVINQNNDIKQNKTVNNLIDVSPEFAIFNSFRDLEEVISKTYLKAIEIHKDEGKYYNPKNEFTLIKQMEYLVNKGYIDVYIFSNYQSLYKLRNQIAHNNVFIAREDALLFIDRINEIINKLKSIKFH